MSIKELNSWFDTLDTAVLAYLFSSEYEEYAGNPKMTRDAFYKKVKSVWKAMPKQEKMDIYDHVVYSLGYKQ